MKRPAIFILLIVAALLLSGCVLGNKAKEVTNAAEQTADIVTGSTALKLKEKADRDLAIARAQTVFKQRRILLEENLSRGPCLDENLLTGWVADIAHNPRQPADDDPANQCENFRNGKATHFVELDLEGILIRAQ